MVDPFSLFNRDFYKEPEPNHEIYLYKHDNGDNIKRTIYELYYYLIIFFEKNVIEIGKNKRKIQEFKDQFLKKSLTNNNEDIQQLTDEIKVISDYLDKILYYIVKLYNVLTLTNISDITSISEPNNTNISICKAKYNKITHKWEWYLN